MNVRAFDIMDPIDRPMATSVERGDDRLQFVAAGPTLDFADADLVILPALAPFVHHTELFKATQLLTQRILKRSEEGGRTCLFYAEDFSGSQCVGGRLLNKWHVSVRGDQDSLAQLPARQFAPYLREYGLPGFVFQVPTEGALRLHVLARSTSNDPSAFAVAEGKGLIYLVPANFVSGSEAALLWALSDAIAAHTASALRPSAAPIAESFRFTAEATVNEERQRQQVELETLDAQLADYRAKKDILFLRDDPLAERVHEWLTQYFRFRARRHEEYIEDFWLVDDQGNDCVICEVKGLNDNVKRQHIRALVLHRDERELDDDFPALLVANTFADAKTEPEKARQRISRLECKNAVKEHVLIVRALDLVRLLDQLERGLVSREDVWSLLTSETGWLKVEGDDRVVIRD